MSTSNRIAPIDMEEEEEEEEEVASFETTSSSKEDNVDPESNSKDQKESNSIEAWLPITESRHGNVWSCVFHLVSSGIGMQSLMIPITFATLGWAWGITCFLLGFVWQLYTKWLLIQLHESESGVRYSRFLQLAMVAFGPKMGKWLCMLPVLYLSGGQCTTIVITAGYNLRFLYEVICSGNSSCSKPLTTTQWFLVFVCFAVLILQHPNLNSLTWVSLLGTITTLLFSSLLWITPLAKGRVQDISYDPTFEEPTSSNLTRFLSVISAMELTALAFRGHNLILEIQGTLPSSSKHPPRRTMWKALGISYVLIGLCMFPLAVAGHWASGNKVGNEGLIIAFWEFHKDSVSTTILGLILIFLIVKQLCSYQIYAMPSVDNFEFRYVMMKKKPCSFRVRRVLRVFFSSVNFVLAVALPFLPMLSPVTGVFNLSLTFVYPCFMWNAIKKPRVSEPMFWLNLVLGCLGILLCVTSFVVAIWNLSRNGLRANFFHP